MSAAVRCAVYTRKSTEEGLEQAFNSLDAQREACEAYIQSQTGEGWKLVQDRYDDGGFSGGSMDRPGLTNLLKDVSAGRIDVVVVYKIDRLTRSLRDFAQIVDQLEERQASFVSVTQAFNTTTSMGRLTLNVLLSFAQFEREVTAERIRDKIAASRKRGIFMGGCPPLGYDIHERKLVINAAEATAVRLIFSRYLEVNGLVDLRNSLEADEIRPKQWVSARGRKLGGAKWYVGPLRHILRNRVYVGDATHKGVSYPGEHVGIISPEIFDAVQKKLEMSRVSEERRRTSGSQALLKGLIFDETGCPMSPQRSRSLSGRQHLYYVSQARIQKRGPEAPRPIPAPAIEEIVCDRLASVFATSHQRHTDAGSCAALEGDELRQALRGLVSRVEARRSCVIIDFHTHALARELSAKPSQVEGLLCTNLPAEDQVAAVADKIRLTVPVQLPLRGGMKRVEGWKQGGWTTPKQRHDPNLIRALALAHEWQAMIMKGDVRSIDELAKRVGQDRKHLQRLLRLAWLAPDIQKDILTGRQPPDLTLSKLIDGILPSAWTEQRKLLSKAP